MPKLPEQLTPSDEELELATALVGRMQTSFDQIDATDHYYEALRSMLDKKIAGEEIQKVDKPAATGKVVDIMDALRASLSINEAQSVPTVSEPEPSAAETPTQPQLTLVSNAPESETKKGRHRKAA